MNYPPGTVLLDESFGTTVVNATDVSTPAVYEAMNQHDRALIATFENWIDTTRPKALLGEEATGSYGSANRRNGGIFMRDRYITPLKIWDQMRLAYEAVTTDDIVAGVCETTESLAFSAMDIFALEQDEQDAYNQIAANIDLDRRMREIWRDLFIVSQAYIAVWWERQTLQVRGKTQAGNKRRREFTCEAPSEMSLLDPLKVVPVGSMLFGKERLAYIATPDEATQFDEILDVGNKEMDDEIVKRLVTAKYKPSRQEILELQALGIPNVDHLYLLNPDNVFRHTLTRGAYERLAPIRMKSVFELLDMKAQLRQMERAHLIGAPLRVDQRIATPDGWKPIGAARVGDRVFGVDGKPTDIVGVFPQGVLSGMFRVTFTDGAKVVCDQSHLWTVADRFGRTRTIPLREIIDEGLFASNGAERRVHKHRIPITAPLELPVKDLPLDPYLLGYLLGDGSLSQSIPKITCAEPEHDQPWRVALPLGIAVSQYETRPGFCPQYGLKGSRWRYNEVTEGLRLVGLWGVVDEDKYIPDEYLWASCEQRWALLQGLCDSDGHSHQRGCVEVATVSRKLADGVVHLAQSLGGVAKISERAPRGNRRVCHRVSISLHQTEAPFRIERKRAAWRPRRVPYVRAIASVEPVADAEAVCIKTAAPDGLFLTEDMVVTHNTNFIIIITKGSDQLPAQPAEIANLQGMVRTLARVPVLVGDHRLNVEIVTPKLDNTLKAERWNTLDSRISGRLLQLMVIGNYSAGAAGDDSIKLVKVMARGMESRRHMIRRSLEKNIFRPLMERNEEFTSMPKLQFHPQAIALDFDAAYASFLFDLRQANEISRETILNQFDLDEGLEAELRKREKVLYDDIFQTQVPFSTPNPAQPPNQQQDPQNPQAPPGQRGLPRDNGGGRRNGGGAAPGSGQGQPSRRRPDRPAAASEDQPPTEPIQAPEHPTQEDLP